MIEARDLWYRYRGGREYAVKGISFTFEGKLMLVTGPNGSGKTTLLKLLALLLKPSQGEVIIDGMSFWRLDERARLSIRRKIVYVHEKPYLFKGSVLDNLAYPLLIRGKARRCAYRRAKDILREFCIEALADRPASELSVGQRQLVALARALVFDPKYVFLDEPFSNLDRQNRALVAEILNEYLARGSVFVISSHNELTCMKADVILYLEDGRVRQDN